MFFILSKLLPWLVYPLPLVLLGLLTIVLCYHHRYARRALALLLVLFYMLSIPLTVRPCLVWLERCPAAPLTLHPHYDYENAVKTADIIRRGHDPDLLLVPSAVHRYRAAGAF